MRKIRSFSLFIFTTTAILLVFNACKKKSTSETSNQDQEILNRTFGGKINLSSLPNYSAQSVPSYITKDNGMGNPIQDKIAILGRVLFYDKKLSSSGTIACASCHKQSLAFGDTPIVSKGVNGVTARHAMRLVNSRFGAEVKFFWDERAASLEKQTSMPIQDHTEMGYSGTQGDGNLATLIAKLGSTDYYPILFKNAFGSTEITETKMQTAIAQFVRSIQSFDSKFDAGRINTQNEGQPFTNFTAQENQGKNLFLQPPVFDASANRTSGGLGCQGCHGAPEFDIAPNSRNNGVTGIANSTAQDYTITRAPSLRNLFNPNGLLNTRLMHDGSFVDIGAVLDHYDNITVGANTNLDGKLTNAGIGQKLHMTPEEKAALIAFLKTLSGSAIYTDSRWADPF